MLPKINRLTKKHGLEDVCKRGKSIRKDCFLIKSKANNLPITRIAFVVSKKVTPKANKRNLLKRRLRNATRNILNSFPIGKDIVIFALDNADKYSFEELKQKLQQLFKN
jgi:ribonuclease P protein component